jgi:hypothetical protein
MKRSKFLCLSFAASVVCASSIAWAGDVVAIMAPGSAAITKDQLANLYLGRSFDLKPLDLPEGNAIREDFYKRTTDRDAAQVKAVWSRVIFTGKGKPPQEVPDAAAVKKAVASDPKMIGYIDKTAVDATVKVVLQVD